MSIKTRLATIPTDSRRYQFVHSIFTKQLDSGKPKKACMFYCVMMPSSALIWLFGIYMTAAMGLVALVLGWFIGLQPAFLKDHAKSPPQRLWSSESTDFSYPYKYSPLRGKQTRFAPWQVLTPLAGVLILWQHWQWKVLLGIAVIAVVMAGTIVLGIGIGSALRWVTGTLAWRGITVNPMKLFYCLVGMGFTAAYLIQYRSQVGPWVSDHHRGLLYFMAGLGVFGIASWVIYLQRPRIARVWSRFCPPLRVVEDEPPRTSEVTA